MANLNPHIPPGVNWSNIHQHVQPLEEVLAQVASWGKASAGTFAGLPRSTEPGYDLRMRQAYEEAIQNIRDVQPAPETKAAGILLGQMWVQANGFASLIQVDGEAFDPTKGAANILAGLPAIVAGRYRQLRQREEGE